MANNRVWLKSKRTGQRVLLGKYFPSRGWGVYDGPSDDFPDARSLALQIENLFGGDRDAQAFVSPSDGGAFELEYEEDEK